MPSGCSLFLNDGSLFRRGLDGLLFQFSTQDEALSSLKEAHQWSCGERQGGLRLHQLLLCTGYHSFSLFQDFLVFTQSYKSC